MARDTVVSIGTFDGIHLGHRAILQELQRQSRQRNLPSLVYAFPVPPRWVMQGDEDRYLLLPSSVKTNLLRGFSDEAYCAPFEAVRAMDPEQFIDTVVLGQLRARAIVEGEAFRFGRDRVADLDDLRSLAARRDLDVVAVPPVMADGEAVSSTRIREAILSGDVEAARRCLGRPPVLLGTVCRGDRLGTSIGYPTANLDVDPHVLLPRPGIFLVHAYGDGLVGAGLLYIGTRPTLAGSDLRCEVHLLDFPGRPLYDLPLEIHILERIRDDRTFPSLDELLLQIERDVVCARRLLSRGIPRADRIHS
jgi:riboflavin kinase / FMN adenylyltransferase